MQMGILANGHLTFALQSRTLLRIYIKRQLSSRGHQVALWPGTNDAGNHAGVLGRQPVVFSV